MLFDRYTSFCVLLLYFSIQSCLGTRSSNDCNIPLGLQDGRISNSQLSSPAHFEHFYIGYGKHVNLKPEYARLNNTYAWCSPSGKKANSSYIEIDLNNHVNVSGIATQGFMGINSYYVKQYKVSYSNNRVTWKFLKEVWTGNSDAQTVVKNTWTPVISARYLRVYPVSYNYRVCMRLELYGCANLSMGTNPGLPVDPTQTVTSPTTVITQEHQTTNTSNLLVTPTLSSVKSATPTPSSVQIKVTNHTPTSVNKRNETLHTTTLRVPWSHGSHESVVDTKGNKDVGERKFIHDDKPEHVRTKLVITFSITAAFLVLVVVPAIMFLIFLLHRKQKRCKGPSAGDSGIPLTTAVIDETLCNQELYDTYMQVYGLPVPAGKCTAVEMNFLNQCAV